MAPHVEETLETLVVAEDHQQFAIMEPMKDKEDAATTAESDVHEEPVQEEVEDNACFDFSIFTACCGLSNKGTCPLCEAPILYSEDSVTLVGSSKNAHRSCFDKEQRETLENEAALKLQTVARAKMARDTLAGLKVEKEVEEEARALKEAVDREAQESASRSFMSRKKKVEPGSPTETSARSQGEKKGFLANLRFLFSGCRKPEEQVQEMPAPEEVVQEMPAPEEVERELPADTTEDQEQAPEDKDRVKSTVEQPDDKPQENAPEEQDEAGAKFTDEQPEDKAQENSSDEQPVPEKSAEQPEVNDLGKSTEDMDEVLSTQETA